MNLALIVLLGCFLGVNANCQELKSGQSAFKALSSTQTISIWLESCEKIEKADKPPQTIVGSAEFQKYQEYFSLLPLMTKENLEFCEKLKRANDAPKIEIDYRVILSSAMEKALKDHDPEFKILSSKHFHPYALATYKFGDAGCASKYYRPLGSPSAVIGDFNNDNKLDVAVLGYTKKPKGAMEYKPSEKFLKRLVILISEQDKYKAHVRNIEELPKNFDPQQPSINLYWIEIVKNGEKITNCAEETLELSADAVRVKDTEKEDGGLILYYENHKIDSFSLCYYGGR
ncbi:MAG: hypothetical protein KKH28_05705 [Elusimicrobia bacterium]|nr:hypothetical protein [Elusimicrobiota bacterium]